MHSAASKRDDVLTTFLLENGAIVDIKDRKGRTALHVAVESENIKNVLKLLQHGANVDLQDNSDLMNIDANDEDDDDNTSDK